VYDITGGTRPGNGPNLFHSFGNFSVGVNNTANFVNNTGLPTTNILGRVTGGNISNIFGTIQTTGFGNANLFLLNPAGFLFGSTAAVNVGGMVAFTTADYIRLADNARFNSHPSVASDLLLSSAPVAAFGFIGSNPAAITVQGSQLTVAGSTGISLVGGNITVKGGTLTAPSGQINLVSVGKPSHSNVGGEVANGGNFAANGFKTLGTINLIQGSTLDTSTTAGTGLAAGPVSIRAGQLVMDSSSIQAVTTTPISALSVVGGAVNVTAQHVSISNSTISTNTSGGSDFPGQSGDNAAGNVVFHADSFSATDSTITAGQPKPGGFAADGGAVTIAGFQPGTSADSVSLVNTHIFTGSGFVGRGGHINISASEIFSNQSTFITFSSDTLGGPIALTGTHHIDVINSSFNASSVFGTGGSIELRAGHSVGLSGTTLSSTSATFIGGSVSLSSPHIFINGGGVNVSTQSNSPGGTITLTADKTVTLTNTQLSANNTLPASVPLGIPSHSDGGSINISAGKSITTQNTTISAQSAAGNGGTIHLEANKIGLTDTEITTSVAGGPQTVGGSINLDANKVTLTNTQVLSTATEGHGGTVGITTHKFNSTNSVLDADSQSGSDGTVTITHH
jgi:filamentous hemagglutinin family protein